MAVLVGNRQIATFMKQATVHLKLNKHNTVLRHNVTPIEALILVSEHHKLVGDNPVEVDKATITDAVEVLEREKDKVEPAVLNAQGLVVTPERVTPGKVTKTRPRTLDEEIDRLRRRYRTDVIDNVLTKVRELPGEDFDLAIKRGIALTSPNTGMGTVASVKLV